MRPRLLLPILFFLNTSLAFSAEASLKNALALAKEGRNQEAALAFRSLLDSDPSNPVYLFNFANTLFVAGRYEDASLYYRKVTATKSPLAVPARLYLAKSLRKLKRYREAAKSLSPLETQKLPPALSRALAEEKAELAKARGRKASRPEAELALEEFKKGRYREAAEKLRAEASIRPQAELYLALALAEVRNGRPVEAEDALVQALALNPSKDLEESSRLLLLQLREGAWVPARHLIPEASIAAGYDSNYYADAENAFEEPTSKAVLMLNAGARHILKEREGFLWQNRYGLGWEGPTSPTNDRTLNYGLETEVILGKKKQLASAWLRFDHYFLPGTTYYYQPAIGFRGRTLRGHTELGLDYSFSLPTATEAAYGFLSGPVHDLHGSASVRNGPAVYGIGLYYQYAGSGDLSSDTALVPLRNHGFGPSAFYRNLLAPRLELYARLSYRFRTYTTLARPGDLKRKDHWKALLVQLEQYLGSGWRASLGASLAFNASTLGADAPDDKNYTQFSFLSALAWSLE